MKNIFGVIAALCVIAVFAGCVSAPSASDGIQSSRGSAPAGTLVASGTGKDAAAAEKAAKEQLIRAMTSMALSMVQDAATAKEIVGNTNALEQAVTTALSRAALNAAVKHGSGEGSGKVFWSVLYMEKAEVLREIDRAVTAAKQSTPGMDTFSTTSRRDATYDRFASRQWGN